MTEQDRHDDRPDPLEAYLDDQLSDAEREAFERRLVCETQLGAAFELQQAIDASLKRAYAPPPHDASAEADEPAIAASRAPASTAASAAGWPRTLREWGAIEIRPRHAAVAAILLIAAGLGVWALWLPGPSRPVGPPEVYTLGPPQTPYEFYSAHVETGFHSAWACPPDVLAAISRERFGTEARYHVPADAEQVRIVGAYYANIFSERTVALFATVGDQPVLVVIDRVEDAERASAEVREVPAESALSLYRRTIDALVFYELSPLDEPHVLEFFQTCGAGDDGDSGTP